VKSIVLQDKQAKKLHASRPYEFPVDSILAQTAAKRSEKNALSPIFTSIHAYICSSVLADIVVESAAEKGKEGRSSKELVRLGG
jgi:hypothetical protein